MYVCIYIYHNAQSQILSNLPCARQGCHILSHFVTLCQSVKALRAERKYCEVSSALARATGDRPRGPKRGSKPWIQIHHQFDEHGDYANCMQHDNLSNNLVQFNTIYAKD